MGIDACVAEPSSSICKSAVARGFSFGFGDVACDEVVAAKEDIANECRRSPCVKASGVEFVFWVVLVDSAAGRATPTAGVGT